MVIDISLIHKLFVLLINIVGVYLSCIVYSSNVRLSIKKLFVLMMIAMFFWVDFAYFARIFGERTELSLLFLKIAWFVTPIFFVLLYFFTIYLQQPN